MTRSCGVLVHRDAGVSPAWFLIVAGLTGSVLACHYEVDLWLNPPPPQTGAIRDLSILDELTLRERALALVPPARIDAGRFRHQDGELLWARLHPRTDPATGNPDELDLTTLMLDPYTGAERSRVNEVAHLPADVPWPMTKQNVIGFMTTWPFRLTLPGLIGIWVLGLAALIGMIDRVVAVYLTLPRFGRLDETGEGISSKVVRTSWRTRWTSFWLVKWRGNTSRSNFDRSRAAGRWLSPMLLIVAWSRVGFKLPPIDDPVMKAVFDRSSSLGPDGVDLPLLPTPQSEPVINWREAPVIGQRLMSAHDALSGFRVQQEMPMSSDFHTGVLT